MSDTWSNIQAHKKQLDSLRERLQRRRKDTTQLGIDLSNPDPGQARSDSPGPVARPGQERESQQDVRIDPVLERTLLLYLSDIGLALPIDSLAITSALSTPENPVEQACVESLLLKFAAQELIEVRPLTSDPSRPPPPTLVTSADHPKLWAMKGAVTSNTASLGEPNTAVHAQPARGGVKRKGADLESSPAPSSSAQSLFMPVILTSKERAIRGTGLNLHSSNTVTTSRSLS